MPLGMPRGHATSPCTMPPTLQNSKGSAENYVIF